MLRWPIISKTINESVINAMRLLLLLFVCSVVILIIANQFVTGFQARDLMVALQHSINPNLVVGLQFLTNSISVVSIGIPVLVLLISELRKDQSTRKKVIIVLVCLGFSGIMSSTVKNMVQKPRPFVIDSRIEKLSGGGSYSFPSGHTTEAVCAAAIMIFTFRNWYVWFFYLGWALTIMYSRMALGVHDIFDLMGGIAIGLGSTLLVLFVASRIVAKKDQLAN